MSNSVSLFDISLIADLIGQHLSKKDAFSCALVNKSFHGQFKKWWMRSIRVWLFENFFGGEATPKPLGPELQEVLIKNRHYIRELDLLEPQEGELIEFIVNKLSPCRLISLGYSSIENDIHSKPLLLLMDLIERNTTLQNLNLLFFDGVDLSCIRFRLISAISSFPYLTTLRLRECMIVHHRDYLALLKRLPMTLQTFEISWCIEAAAGVGEVVHFPDIDWPKAYLNMQDLFMDLQLDELEDTILFPFLRRCPALEEFRIMQSDGVIHERLYPLLADTSLFPRLATIDLRNDFQGYPAWTSLISAMEGRIKTFAADCYGILPVENMCERWWATLEVIRFGWYSNISSEQVGLILTTCSKLRTLAVFADFEDYQFTESSGFWAWELGSYLDATKWVCLGLKHLELTFMDARAGSALVKGDYNQSNVEFRTFSGIHAVCYQLGRLTKLQHLRLGWSTIEKFRNRANLDMSIKNGLMHMAGLKELEVLDVTCILQVNIEQEEAEWMEENWPKLRRIKGLFRKDSKFNYYSMHQEHLYDEDTDRVNRDESSDPIPIQWLRSQRPQLVIS
ncbi:hypothetical protein BGX27_009827 [Mortierella sp. AM989]|nr:hypothetical protein BGX27_009827 [Mortierella sp. AM989]